MNSIEAEGNRTELKGKLLQKFAELTDNDLVFKEGMREEIFGKLLIKLGKKKEKRKRLAQGTNHIKI